MSSAFWLIYVILIHTTTLGVGTTVLAPIYGWGNGDSERLGNLPRDTQQTTVASEPRPDLTPELPPCNHVLARPLKGTCRGPNYQGWGGAGVSQRRTRHEQKRARWDAEWPKWRTAAAALGRHRVWCFQGTAEGPAWLRHREHSCPKEGPGREFLLPDYMSSDQKDPSF